MKLFILTTLIAVLPLWIVAGIDLARQGELGRTLADPVSPPIAGDRLLPEEEQETKTEKEATNVSHLAAPQTNIDTGQEALPAGPSAISGETDFQPHPESDQLFKSSKSDSPALLPSVDSPMTRLDEAALKLDTDQKDLLKPPTPGSLEYGEQPILARNTQRYNWNPWRVSFDLGVFGTDNAGLASRNEQSDSFLQTSFTADYTPQIKGQLFGDISLRQSFYRYDRFSELDFDLTTTELGFLYVARGLADIHFHAHYRFDQFTDDGFGSARFTNHALVLGAYQILPLRKPSREQAKRGYEFYLGAKGSFSLDASPGQARRNEYTFDTGVLLRWTPTFRTQARYRISYHDYAKNSRHDLNHMLVLSAEYDITKTIKLDAHVSFTLNDSNLGAFDYDVLSPGVGVGIVARF